MARSVYTWFSANVLFPCHERIKGHDTVRLRREMEQSQWLSGEELQRRQIERLRGLLCSVQSRVPYFSDVIAQTGCDVASVRSTTDLTRLPFLTKALIRANLERIKAKDAGRLMRSNTGGSSGEPLIFYLSKTRVAHDVAAKWRATRWWGVDIGDPEVVVWGSPIELAMQDRLRSLRDRLLRTRLLPAFEMSPEKLDRFVADIRAARPRMLFGYPSALAYIARHARCAGKRLDDLGVEVAFVTSERLYDDQRAAISEAFGCRVANGYGGRDAGFIAHECPAGGMHITAEDIIVEIIGPDGTPVPHGQSGEIVVTHLASADFPLIRYRTGDIAALDVSRCPCGRGLPLLKDIQGRTTDFVVARDGTVMHGLALIYVLRDLPGIEAFKIVQETLDYTRVMVVLAQDAAFAALREQIVNGLRARLGLGTTVDVERVDRVPAERSGKFRYVVSHAIQ